MKFSRTLSFKQGLDTDLEQTASLAPLPKLPKRKLKPKRTPKYKKQLRRLKAMTNYIKIMRFKARHERKTYRVYCYDEDSLGWPYRFTKKLNTMYADNDRDSDSQIIQHDKQKCLNSLFEAIEQRKQQKLLQNQEKS